MYLLKCSDDTYYVGSTWDIERRLRQHKEGRRANYPRKRLPVELVYSEFYDRIINAYFRERQIHNWSHEKKKALIQGKIDNLQKLAKKKFKKK